MSISYRVLSDPKPEALVIHCFDPRFITAIDRFLTDDCELPSARRLMLIVPGGPASLAHAGKLPDHYRAYMEGIELALNKFTTITQLIAIGHENCAFCERRFGTHYLYTKARSDLLIATKTLQDMFQHVTVNPYYAALNHRKDHTSFEKVEPRSAIDARSALTI